MRDMFLLAALQQGPPDRQMGWMTPYLLLAVLLVVLVVLLVLLLFFPRLEGVRATDHLRPAAEARKADSEIGEEDIQVGEAAGSRTVKAALRLLEPDERRVMDLLINEGGTMLQKDVSHELGFSRVKTHRVLVKLIRRGAVTAQKYYNTNRITLADWLRSDS